MAEIVFLGTASAVSFEGHENSYFVVKGEGSSLLIDCAANPVMRLKQAGVDPDNVSDLIITHFHPDHVSGLANFLMEMWLLGREDELNIHGSEHSISRAQILMDLFEWNTWEGMFPVHFKTIPLEEGVEVLHSSEFQVWATPVEHMIPTLGLRIDYQGGKFVAVYSSDTNPIPGIARLAAGADVLIHEAAGPSFGHSTASEAGEIAAQSGVNALYLIHYAIYGDITADKILDDAKKTFPGPVCLAEDFMKIDMV